MLMALYELKSEVILPLRRLLILVLEGILFRCGS